jgi:L-fucose mutarotase
MLKGINPLLGPDLLSILRAMGHGDEIVISDANFPAEALATRLVRMDGVGVTPIVGAIVEVLPLDHFELDAAFRMEVSGAPEHVPAVIRELSGLLAAVGYSRRIAGIERGAFYERARDAFAIVVTGETRLWANLILKKGAIAPEP